MNALDKQLVFFSVAFSFVIALMLIVPIVRRKSDVFTSWNFFLVGAFVFNGMSGLNSAWYQQYLPSLSGSSYHAYYIGTVVFYAVIALTYYYFKIPRRLAGETMRSWPAFNSVTSPIIALAFMSLIACILVRIPIPFIGEVTFMFALVSPGMAVSVLAVAWFRDRKNVLLFTLLLICLPLAAAGAVGVGGSRKYLINVLAAVPVSLYWVWLRYRSNAQILAVMGIMLAIAVPTLAAYGMIRHARHDVEKLNAATRAKAIVNALPNALKSGGTSEGFMGQDSVECALSVVELMNNGSRELEVHPLASLWLIATNAIPRSVWEEKPDSLGFHLIHHFSMKYTNANLGLNVVGQGYYDGGLIVLVLYALMMGSFLRYYDELLVRRPGNPLLISGLVGMSAVILGWPRG